MRRVVRCCAALALAGAALCLSGCGALATAPRPTAQAPLPSCAQTQAPDLSAEPRLSQLDLRDKVGQLFIVRPDALDLSLDQDTVDDAGADGVCEMSDALREALDTYPVGGVVLFSKNIRTPDQLCALTAGLQAESSIGMFIAVDEEGGAVARLAGDPDFDLPVYKSTADVGARGPQAAGDQALAIGAYLAACGINLNFAPVADVNTNPANTVIGDRAFSSDPHVAADCVAAAVQGYSQAGVACCVKHFPGHGDTAQDSHDGAVYLRKTLEELRACELVPFTAGIDAGVPMVMAGHIQAPDAWDDGLPASLSPCALTGILREELGFEGVIVTDSLAMGAITEAYTPGQAAVMALQAGADLLLMPAGLPEAFDGVMDAVRDGRLSEDRIDESVARVLALKEELGLLA